MRPIESKIGAIPNILTILAPQKYIGTRLPGTLVATTLKTGAWAFAAPSRV